MWLRFEARWHHHIKMSRSVEKMLSVVVLMQNILTIFGDGSANISPDSELRFFAHSCRSDR